MSYKVFDFHCKVCDVIIEVFTNKKSEKCEKCNKKMTRLPGMAGYHIRGNNSASTRPRGAGSRRRK